MASVELYIGLTNTEPEDIVFLTRNINATEWTKYASKRGITEIETAPILHSPGIRAISYIGTVSKQVIAQEIGSNWTSNSTTFTLNVLQHLEDEAQLPPGTMEYVANHDLGTMEFEVGLPRWVDPQGTAISVPPESYHASTWATETESSASDAGYWEFDMARQDWRIWVFGDWVYAAGTGL